MPTRPVSLPARITDASGVPLPNARLDCFEAGTNSRTNVYVDALLTTAHANPVLADAGGLLPPVYLDPAVKYRLRATTSAGIPVAGMDYDPVPGASSSDDRISLLDFIPATLHAEIRDRTSTVDISTYLQNAINYLNSLNGGELYVPSGCYTISSTINLCNNLKITGAGKRTSTLLYTASGSATGATSKLTATGATVLSGTAFRMESAVNTPTGVFIDLHDLEIRCTNPANVGAGFWDTSGGFITLQSVYILNFKYQVILDQSEIVHIDRCYFESASTSSVADLWLTNGPDLTQSASGEFTNQITISRCQFNGNAQYGVLDDGGYDHEYRGNNFNGHTSHFRICDVQPCLISGGEYEASSSYGIVSQASTLSGLGGGASHLVMQGGIWATLTNTIYAGSAHTVSMTGVQTSCGNAPILVGAANIGYIFYRGGRHSSVTLFDGYAGLHDAGFRPIVSDGNVAVTATYSHRNAHVRLTNAAAITYTLPLHSTVPLQIGSEISVEQAGAGQISFSPVSGVTLLTRGGLNRTNGQFARVTLLKLEDNSWLLSGDRA